MVSDQRNKTVAQERGQERRNAYGLQTVSGNSVEYFDQQTNNVGEKIFNGNSVLWCAVRVGETLGLYGKQRERSEKKFNLTSKQKFVSLTSTE